MQSAAVFELKDRLLVHPWQRTTTGLLVASEPYISLPLGADPKTLGDSVLTVLNASGRTVPHPKSWKDVAAARLEAAGVKSERAFQLGARCLNVEREARALRIEPSCNGGAAGDSKGFELLPQVSESLPLHATADEMAAAIHAGFERCR